MRTKRTRIFFFIFVHVLQTGFLFSLYDLIWDVCWCFIVFFNIILSLSTLFTFSHSFLYLILHIDFTNWPKIEGTIAWYACLCMKRKRENFRKREKFSFPVRFNTKMTNLKILCSYSFPPSFHTFVYNVHTHACIFFQQHTYERVLCVQLQTVIAKEYIFFF